MLPVFIDDVNYALALLEIQMAFWSESAVAATRQLVDNLLGGLDAWNFRASDSQSPAMLVARRGQNALLVVHGTDLESQYAPEAAAYVNPVSAFSDTDLAYPTSAWVENAGNLAYNLGLAVNAWQASTIWTCGHSAGHGISTRAFYSFLKDAGGHTSVKNYDVSFGGNAWANQAIVDNLLNNYFGIRYMNDDDPVPLLPFCVMKMLGNVAILAPSNVRRILNFRHIGVGKSISKAGTITDSVFPQLADVAPTSSLVGWLTTFDSGAPNSHWCAEYKTRLLLSQGQVQPAGQATPPNPVTAENPPISITPPETSAAAARLQADTATSLEQEIAALPPDQPSQLSENRFMPVHGPAGWIVQLAGTTVAAATGRKQARSIARHLNRVNEEVLSVPTLDSSDVLRLILTADGTPG